MMTDPGLRPLDSSRSRARPATRTGWWLPITALVGWLVYRQVDVITAAGLATIGAAVFLAVFGLSVLRAAAHRWWGGTLRATPPRR